MDSVVFFEGGKRSQLSQPLAADEIARGDYFIVASWEPGERMLIFRLVFVRRSGGCS